MCEFCQQTWSKHWVLAGTLCLPAPGKGGEWKCRSHRCAGIGETGRGLEEPPGPGDGRRDRSHQSCAEFLSVQYGGSSGEPLASVIKVNPPLAHGPAERPKAAPSWHCSAVFAPRVVPTRQPDALRALPVPKARAPMLPHWKAPSHAEMVKMN